MSALCLSRIFTRLWEFFRWCRIWKNHVNGTCLSQGDHASAWVTANRIGDRIVGMTLKIVFVMTFFYRAVCFSTNVIDNNYCICAWHRCAPSVFARYLPDNWMTRRLDCDIYITTEYSDKHWLWNVYEGRAKCRVYKYKIYIQNSFCKHCESLYFKFYWTSQPC